AETAGSIQPGEHPRTHTVANASVPSGCCRRLTAPRRLCRRRRLDRSHQEVSRARTPSSDDPQPRARGSILDLPDELPLAAQDEVRPVRPDTTEDRRRGDVTREDGRGGDLEPDVLVPRPKRQVGPLATPLRWRSDVAVQPQPMEASHASIGGRPRENGGDHGDSGDEPRGVLHWPSVPQGKIAGQPPGNRVAKEWATDARRVRDDG